MISIKPENKIQGLPRLTTTEVSHHLTLELATLTPSAGSETTIHPKVKRTWTYI